jgi:hypothetical protein
VHVIDGTSRDPLGDFHAINLELELFNPELKDKPQVGGCCALASPSDSAWSGCGGRLAVRVACRIICVFAAKLCEWQGAELSAA